MRVIAGQFLFVAFAILNVIASWYLRPEKRDSTLLSSRRRRHLQCVQPPVDSREAF